MKSFLTIFIIGTLISLLIYAGMKQQNENRNIIAQKSESGRISGPTIHWGGGR